LVVVIGLVLGLSLSVGGGLIGNNKAPDKEELAWEQARLFAEVLERVKRDYVEPIEDAELLESAIRGMVSDLRANTGTFASARRAATRALASRSMRSAATSWSSHRLRVRRQRDREFAAATRLSRWTVSH
jgi:C-terminal processing protease CtpA/Prc